MARNGSGTFSLLAPVAVANTVSSSTSVNATMDDIATALTESINKDGTKAFEANQSVGGFKFTSLGSGSARTDSINMGQVQDGKANWVAAGGTADVITATYSPAITALVDGQECTFRASAANTSTTPTFSPNGLTARTIVKNGGSALAVGDIAAAGHEVILKYLLASTRWELLNPAAAAGTSSSAGILELATDAETQTGTDTARAITPANLTAKEAIAGGWFANTANRILTTDITWGDAALVSLSWTSGGNTAVDMATGINFTVTAATGNSTLGQPSNTKVGQTGVIRIIQDSTPRTLAFHADWKFAGGSDPTISTGSGAVDLLFYQVIATNFIYATLVKAVA